MAEHPFLPYGRQTIDDSDADTLASAIRHDFLTTGPGVAAFESDLVDVTTAPYAVAVSSGTAALHAAYFAAGLGPGDELITTPLTFAGTANAARFLGADVSFVDVRSHDGNIDPEAVASAITDRTKIVCAVDYAGHPCDYAALGAICRDAGVTLIADAAHSLGATLGGRPVGTLADASTFSFHPVKVVTTGEGGAVVTSNQALAERARSFRNHGINRDPETMSHYEGPWYYEISELGLNYRVTDLQCALGRNQLARLGDFVGRRRAIAARYLAELACDELILPTIGADVEPAWHLFVVRVTRPELRRRFFERLRELRLGVQVHYVPVHYHPYYRNIRDEVGKFPKAEAYYGAAVSLPIYPTMTDADVGSVVGRVKQAVDEVLRS
ncbi:MAG: UDP-4-amino-4,6-dideoxy-N-acetyl-beta-L-altrosamine transaminase [Myxococcota bacterium]